MCDDALKELLAESELRRNLAEFNSGWVASDTDLSQLPRWALIAYAGRVVERVSTMFTRMWPGAPEPYRNVITDIVTAVTTAANNCKMDNDRTLRERAAAAMSAYEAASGASVSTAGAVTIKFHCDSAAPSNLCEAAIALCDMLEGAHESIESVRSFAGDAIGSVVWAIEEGDLIDEVFDEIQVGWLRDYRVLLAYVTARRTTDTDAIPASVFGSLWPGRVPKYWLENEVPAAQQAVRLSRSERRSKAIGTWAMPRGINADKLVAKQVEWRTKNLEEYDEYLQDNRSRLNQQLDYGDFQHAKLIGDSCELVAGEYARIGFNLILSGDPLGWSEIDRSMLFHTWGIRFKVGVALKLASNHELYPAIQLVYSTANFASALCYSYISGQENLMHVISQAWRLALEVTEVFSDSGQSFWDGGTQGLLWYEAFCLRLFRSSPSKNKWKLPDFVLQNDLGPFRSVVQHWKNPQQFGRALEVALDYHCLNFDDYGPGSPSAPFKNLPFDLFPVWLIAVKKRRMKEKIETPQLTHPLLSLPTANPADNQFGVASDPAFNLLAQMFQKLDLKPRACFDHW